MSKPIDCITYDLEKVVPTSSGASDFAGAKYATAPDGSGSPWVLGVALSDSDPTPVLLNDIAR
jgi:hypothetical protein